MRHVLTALVLPLAFACAPAGDAPTSSLVTTVDTTGTVPVITVTGEAPEWTLDSLAVIRPDRESGFSNIRSLALDPRGGVWVADVGEQRLSRWGDDGAWVEDKGHVGAGPSEFRTPYSAFVHANGLLVLDIENSRIVRFDLAGGADSSWLIPSRVTGTATDARLFPDPDGPRFLHFVVNPDPQIVFVRVTDSTDRVIQPGSEGGEPTDVKVCPFSNGIRFFSSPFAPRAVRSPWLDATVASANGDYQIERFDRASHHVSTVRRPVARDSISATEFETETADWRKFEAEHGNLSCTGQMIRYEFKPAIRYLLPDDDGRLWVEQRLPGGQLRFEVWSGDSLVGMMPVPERLEEFPPAVRGDRLAVVAESPDGGHEVRLYRIRRD